MQIRSYTVSHLAHTVCDTEERYKLLVDSVQDYAIFMLDPDGNIMTWNQGAERIKGYKADEIIGQHFSRFYPQADIDAGKPQMELRVARAQGRFEDEGWRLRKDGTRFWANVILTALFDKSGALRGFGKVTRDLTERRRAEQQARELEGERARAEAESRRKDEFLAMLAHELRNPLAPLLTGLALLRRSGGDESLRARMLDMMGRQLQHLKRLVEGLLDVARIARDKIELQHSRLDLARLIRQAAEDRRPGLEQAGLHLHVAASDTPIWVWGDDIRLVQVFSNLLDNAAKFSVQGGNIEVRVEVDARARQALVTVRDEGAGIPSALLSHLFEPFMQADHSLDRSRGGLGLGLAVARGLVDLHGGRMEADSPGEEQGAEFRFRLPLQEEPPPLTEQAAEQGADDSKLRVVVIEDNPDSAETLQMLLQALGHQVRVARTGPDGVEAVAAWRPDAVICDIGLPGMDGFKVAAELRRNPETAGVRLIALTGYGSVEDRTRGRQAGFDFYLVKPADPHQLQHLLVSNSA